MSDEQETTQTIVVRQKPRLNTTTLLVGGGIVGLLLWLLFFRGGGGSGVFDAFKRDRNPLKFVLRLDGLYLGQTKMDVTAAIKRIFDGRRNDVLLVTVGDVPQGTHAAFVDAFRNAGISVLQQQPQSVASIYRRGLGGVA